MIRLYTYSGFIEVDRQPFLKEPYLGRAVVKAGVTSKPDAAPAATRLAHLVSDGLCTYEITPEGHTPRIADKDSPALDGDDIVAFGPGWTISVWTAECEIKAEPVRDDRMAADLAARIAAAKPGEPVQTTAGELAALVKGGIT